MLSFARAASSSSSSSSSRLLLLRLRRSYLPPHRTGPSPLRPLASSSSSIRPLASSYSTSASSARGGGEDDPDYVVLGAGSAGCVLSSRLTEDARTSVLLLEAGPPDRGRWDSWQMRMPAALTKSLGGDGYNWDYATVEQPHLGGRRLHQPRGRVLGGSSSINAMVYVRGHALDFDRWDDEIGDGLGEPPRSRDGGGSRTGWRYRDVLPYFKRASAHQLAEAGDPYRGWDGPLSVTNGRTLSGGNPLFDAFVEAGVQAGHGATDDFNGYRQEGFGPLDQTVTTGGERCSASVAYLHPAMERAGSRLRVRTEALVTKLIFDDDGGGEVPVCRGVTFTDKRTGKVETVRAGREVILSLGAVGTPQLLQLSGIGHADALRALDVPLVHHSPAVGSNLQDHLEFYIQQLCREPISIYPVASPTPYPHRHVAAGLRWFARGDGVCASNQFEAGGFVRTAPSSYDPRMKHPDVQFHFIPACVVGQLDVLPHHGYQVHVGTLRPTSRGAVRIASSDPNDAPYIDPNYMATEEDASDLRAAFRIAMEVLQQRAFDPYRGDLHSPGPATMTVDPEDDAQVDEFIRRYSHSAYHPSCTASMGSVVDSEGRVLGVDGLRVVDASIMPSMTSGNLNAPTIMLAEKIADAIRGREPMEPEDVPVFGIEGGRAERGGRSGRPVAA